MSWGRGRGNAGAGNGSSHFIRLEDGGTVQGVIRGLPYEFWQHWIEGRSVECLGHCEYCREGVESSFRFRVNFIVMENGAHVAKILELGRGVFEYLQALHAAGYDLERTLLSIQRRGVRMGTTYLVIPLPGQLPEEAHQALSQVKLHDVESIGRREPEAPSRAEPSWGGRGRAGAGGRTAGGRYRQAGREAH